ncbi:MAG: DMT family transporter [Desulfurococcales archaeon]|nr:DMT family transporter [Desulfurococcales archaeon]
MLRDYLILLLAVVNISFASILVRLLAGEGVHGFAAATWRLAISALLTLALLTLRGWEGPRPGAKDLALMTVAGVGLALHFDLWMLSLAYTSVAVSVTIVDSYPALLAVAGRLLLGERYSPIQYLGAVVAMVGVVLLATGGRLDSPTGMLGPLLAFGGMIGVGVYFIVGKVLRARYSTLAYTGVVYTIAAVVSALLSLAIGVELWGYNARSWTLLILLALLPMMGGHTLLNYLLRRLSLLATTVPVLGEPVGATILAALLLGEAVGLETVLFMAVTLAGIGLTLAGEGRRG